MRGVITRRSNRSPRLWCALRSGSEPSGCLHRTKHVVTLNPPHRLEHHLETLNPSLLAEHQNWRLDGHLHTRRRLEECFVHRISLANIGDSAHDRLGCLEIGDRDWWKVEVCYRRLGSRAVAVDAQPSYTVEEPEVIWRINVIDKTGIIGLAWVHKPCSVIEWVGNFYWSSICLYWEPIVVSAKCCNTWMFKAIISYQFEHDWLVYNSKSNSVIYALWLVILNTYQLSWVPISELQVTSQDVLI